jgi:hypothetical protein
MPRLPLALTTSGLVALALILPSGALAANCDFTGSGSWHSSGNWSCAVVPDGDDSVTIGSGDAVTVGAAASAASLSLSAGTIMFSSDSTLAVGGAMGVTSGTLAGAGTVTVGGAFSKTDAGALAVTNDGIFGPSADLVLNGAGTLSGGSMCVADNGDGNPDLPNLQINNTFTVAEGASANPFNCTSGPRIHVNAPNGHLVKAASGTTSFGTMVENDDTLTVQAGELILQGGTGGTTSAGAYIANAGTALQFGTCCAENFQIGSTGRVGGAGTIDVRANPLELAAGATLDPAVLNLEFAGLVLNGTSATTLPVLNFNGGGFNPSFDTDRPVTATTLSVTGAGTISGGGSVTVPSGGSFSKTGSGTLSVTNSGTFGESADLILDVDARLDGGSMCVGDSSDGNADLPSMQINQDLAIGAAADSTTFTCSANVVRVNGPSGHLFKEGAGTITNHGRFDVAGGMLSIGAGQTFVVANGISQSGGVTSIASGGVLQGSATLTGGTLRGAGQVTGNLTNTSGTVEPGSSPGTLTVTGNYTQGPGGTLQTEITGTTPGSQFDRLEVGGAVSLDGTLAIVNAGGFSPALTDTFQILTGSSVSGTFAQLTGATNGNRIYEAQYNPADVTLTVGQGPEPDPDPDPDPDPGSGPAPGPPAPPPPPAGNQAGGLISESGCLNTDASLTGTQLGPAKLGRKLAEQRAIFQGANKQTRANLDRYCAEGGGNFRIGYPTPRLMATLSRALQRKVKDRVVIVLTSSKRFSLGGIKVGDATAAARRRLSGERAFKVGSNTWYVAKRGKARLLVKTKNGRVGEIGIGDPRLSTTPKATKRFLNAWKLV